MASKRHKVFNVLLILIPWLSILFIGKRSIKRYILASVFIAIFEILNHLYAHIKKWWEFYDKPQLFLRNELPFDIALIYLFLCGFLNLQMETLKSL